MGNWHRIKKDTWYLARRSSELGVLQETLHGNAAYVESLPFYLFLNFLLGGLIILRSDGTNQPHLWRLSHLGINYDGSILMDQ